MLKVNFTSSMIPTLKRQQNATAPAPSTNLEQNLKQNADIKSVYYDPRLSLSFKQFALSRMPLNTNILSIYYYNDTHGNSDLMAEVISHAKKFKQDSELSNAASFVLSAGDNCSGGDAKKNEFIFDLMQNIMGVDASAVGNHEVDAKSDGFYQAAKDKNLSFIATNVDFDDDNPMKDIVKKSMILEKGGVRYGFVGAMPIDFKDCTKEEAQKGLNVKDFDNTVKALQDEINNLKAQGIDRIIMLSHVGYDVDKKLASALDGVDVIIGGHTHTVVEGAKEDENVIKSKSGEPVIITQGGENGKYYGILNVEFDNKGVLTRINNNLTPTSNRYKSPIIEYVKTQNLGVSPHVGTIKEIPPIAPNRRIEPCAWTALAADAMRSEMGTDIAIINSANLRKVPQPGNLTAMDITESFPMKNELITTKITQKQLVEAIGNTARKTMSDSDGVPGLLQGSGFTYKIDDKGNLLEMAVTTKNGKTQNIDIKNPSDKITYTAVYDSFVARAGGETPELEPKFNVKKFEFDKDKTLIDYIAKMDNKEDLKIKDDGRLQILHT